MNKKQDLKTLIRTDSAMKEITASLPDHVKPERWTRTVLTCLNKNPKLAQCTRASFFSAMMDCSEAGLEPNGRDAHLIPYGDQAQFIVDYKGLIKLAYQSDKISSIYANVVYEGDQFDYSTCDHVPWGWLSSSERSESQGKCIGAYVVIEKKEGGFHRERMTFDEIEAIRKRSKAGRSGPWVTDWNEMAKKTVFRRASKWIQLSPHVERAIEMDFDSFQPIDVKPVKAKSIDAEQVRNLLEDLGSSDDERGSSPSSEFKDMPPE